MGKGGAMGPGKNLNFATGWDRGVDPGVCYLCLYMLSVCQGGGIRNLQLPPVCG